MALLELPRLDLLTLAVGTELDLDAGRAEKRGRVPKGRSLLAAQLVAIQSPRLGKLVHVELEEAVAAHGVVALVAVVVAAKATEAPPQVGRCHYLHEAVAVPGDLQTGDGGELQQVAVQVNVDSGAVVRQRNASAVSPHRQVLVETQDQSSQSHLHRLGPGEGAGPPGVILHQHLCTHGSKHQRFSSLQLRFDSWFLKNDQSFCVPKD